MQKISYRRHRFPSEIIQHAVWLYFRFPLSYRDVEDLLAERGIDVSYETVRRWALKFGQAYARKLRRLRPRPDCRWHLDEVFVSIARRIRICRFDNESEGCRASGHQDRREGFSPPTPPYTTPSMSNVI